MAYNGYLIKVGDYTIPLSIIRAETYQVTKNGQDLDSYRDANGYLHRNALAHFCNKVEFETKPLMTSDEMATVMKNIQANYTNAIEKKANVTCYVPESDSYETQEMYMPDITYKIYTATNGVLKYEQTRLAFISY